MPTEQPPQDITKESKKQIDRFLPRYQKIALVGFRGVGKSTLASRLTKYWQVNHYSLDKAIEHQELASISEVVARHGWNYFRALETKLLKHYAGLEENLLLDTGGGIVEGSNQKKSEEKIDILKNRYFCIYLYINSDTVLKRLGRAVKTEHRPDISRSEKELRQVFERRKTWFKEAARAIVDVSDMGIDEATQRVMKIIGIK